MEHRIYSLNTVGKLQKNILARKANCQLKIILLLGEIKLVVSWVQKYCGVSNQFSTIFNMHDFMINIFLFQQFSVTAYYLSRLQLNWLKPFQVPSFQMARAKRKRRHMWKFSASENAYNTRIGLYIPTYHQLMQTQINDVLPWNSYLLDQEIITNIQLLRHFCRWLKLAKIRNC